MKINFKKFSAAELDKYDIVTEKFENLVHKQSTTLFLNEREKDFMSYVGRHFYVGTGHQNPAMPTPHCLVKAFEMSKTVYI